MKYYVGGNIIIDGYRSNQPSSIQKTIDADSFDDAYNQAKLLDWNEISDIHAMVHC